MSRLYTAIFTEKSTGKVLFKLTESPLNKYMWEKAKAITFEKLVKDRFIDKHEIIVKDYEGENYTW